MFLHHVLSLNYCLIIALFLQVDFDGPLPNKDYVFDAEIAVFNYFMNKIEDNKHFFVKIYYLFKKKYLSLYTNKC